MCVCNMLLIYDVVLKIMENKFFAAMQNADFLMFLLPVDA